jgi:uncharacterized repeat protein (TIGR01451 family)
VEPGRFYDYSAWVQADLVQGDAYLRTTFWSQQGEPPVWELLGEESHTTSVTDTQGAWVKVTGSAQAPVNAEYARVEAILLESSLGSVWFDDVFFGLATCLDISKSDDLDPVEPGQTLTYTIVYSNTGRESATDVEIIEDYDDYVNFVDAQPPPSASTNIWEMPELLPGDSGTITVVVQVEDDTELRVWLLNEVEIHSDETVAPVCTTISTTILIAGDCVIVLYLPDVEKPGEPGYPTDYDLILWNAGSYDGQFDLVTTSSQGWDVIITPSPPYTLTSGGLKEMTVSPVVPQDTSGGTVDVTFITATLVCELPCEPAIETRAVTTTVDPTPPIFLAFGPIMVRGGFLSSVFLPIVMNGFWGGFEGPWEVEPNNWYDEANGPLRLGGEYFGYPNDDWDLFGIDLYPAGRLSVDLTIPTGEGVQLQLRDQEGRLLDYKHGSPYHIEYAGTDVRYYICVFTESVHNSDKPYILWVRFPLCVCMDTREPDDYEHYLEWPPLEPGMCVDGYICYEHMHLEDSQWLERDWYYFQIDSLYDIEVDLDVPDTVNYDLFLWVGDHWEPSENPERGADEHIEWSPWGIGTYVVVVKSLGDADNCTPYTLKVTLKPQ